MSSSQASGRRAAGGHGGWLLPFSLASLGSFGKLQLSNMLRILQYMITDCTDYTDYKRSNSKENCTKRNEDVKIKSALLVETNPTVLARYHNIVRWTEIPCRNLSMG